MLFSDLKHIVEDLEKSSNEKNLWKMEDNTDIDLDKLDLSFLEGKHTITIGAKNSEFVRVYRKKERWVYIRTCQDCKQEFESPRQFEAICDPCKLKLE